MLAGSISKKNIISNQPVQADSFGIINPVAAAISRTPVTYTTACLCGIRFGSIIVMPLVKAAWATAVKTNMTAIAIRADSGKLYPLPRNLILKTAVTNARRRTISGFNGVTLSKGRRPGQLEQ
jgi:hypothetical protein